MNKNMAHVFIENGTFLYSLVRNVFMNYNRGYEPWSRWKRMHL